MTLTVDIAPDLVYQAGGPVVITNTAEITHSGGPDNNPINNQATQTTQVVAVSDIAIVKFEAVNPPTDIVIGEDVSILLQKTITNKGPSAPVNVELKALASAEAGATVTPLELKKSVSAIT